MLGEEKVRKTCEKVKNADSSVATASLIAGMSADEIVAFSLFRKYDRELLGVFALKTATF